MEPVLHGYMSGWPLGSNVLFFVDDISELQKSSLLGKWPEVEYCIYAILVALKIRALLWSHFAPNVRCYRPVCTRSQRLYDVTAIFQ